jgi:hypothetical protein
MDIKLGPKNREELLKLLYKSIYILAFAFCLFKIHDFKHLNFGYTPLPKFGDQFHEKSLIEIKKGPVYIQENPGYDGQFYAQLALRPSATGEDIENALDNYIYRARRILFSWTAWSFGLGNPDWTLQAYGWQNGLFWLLTGLLLLKWMPPNHWQDTLRFLASFFTAGIIYSFNSALLDGPSLFLIVLAAYFIESRRSWLGTGILGLAGLGKETNLLAVFSLWKPSSKPGKEIFTFALKAGLAFTPFFLWFAYIYLNAGDYHRSLVAGSGNFHLPLVGFFAAALEVLKKGGETGFPASAYAQFIALGSLLAQGVYLAIRPKLDNVWWRIGISYTILMAFLGPAVWEGLIAAPRVLLPMTIAFNIVFSRRTCLLPFFIFANSLTLIGLNSLQPQEIPERVDFTYQSPLAYNPETEEYSDIQFTDGWYVAEGKSKRYWRWSNGDGLIEFDLPGDQKVNAVLEFQPRTISPREIALEVNGLQVWRMLSGGGYGDLQSIPFVINPGKNTLRIYSPQPPERFGQDPRDLSFSLGNYQLHLISVVPE